MYVHNGLFEICCPMLLKFREHTLFELIFNLDNVEDRLLMNHKL